MDYRPPPEAPQPMARRRQGMRRGLWLLAGALLWATPLPCEEKALVGGLLDSEIWKTDDGSRLLSRNEGEAAPAAHLRLWAAGDFTTQLQGFVMGYAQGGKGTEEGTTETELEQAYLRFSFKPPVRMMFEAGKMTMPIGNFSRRYLSNVNPLIGAPDSYSVTYPLGVQVSGQAARFDFRASLLDKPFVNEGYVPEGIGQALRPALAVGVTPAVGTRLGAYATRGPYLGPSISSMLPAGAEWRDFRQGVYGADVQFSRGYFEVNGDFARSSYEVPGVPQSVRGTAWFIEPKYTWTPRFFTALRLERNDYPYIMPINPFYWLHSNADLFDVEAGAGYRFGPGTILKVAYRRDYWRGDPSGADLFPDGYSFSAQLSYRFDVNSWFERPR